jgi:hypothetical protein
MVDFDVILRMDWHSHNCAMIDCRGKKVDLVVLGKDKFYLQGGLEKQVDRLKPIMSTIKACKDLQKKCKYFLANAMDTQKKSQMLEDISVVCDFLDVFPKELLRLPHEREVEFVIVLIPGAESISKALYKIALAKLRELKTQLQELFDMGFIRLSVSP